MRPRCTAAPPPAAQDRPLSLPLERRRLAQKQVQHMGAQSRLALDFTIRVFEKPESNAPQRHCPLPGIVRCRRRWSAAAWPKNKCSLMMSNPSLLCHARPKIAAEQGSSGRVAIMPLPRLSRSVRHHRLLQAQGGEILRRAAQSLLVVKVAVWCCKPWAHRQHWPAPWRAAPPAVAGRSWGRTR